MNMAICWGESFGNYMDDQGKELLPADRMHEARTKMDYPYSYSPLLLYVNKKIDVKSANGTIYSDRMMQQNFDKHDELLMKHFGDKRQYWDRRNPVKVQEFLRDWCDCKNLMLLRIVEYCNISNGYPCWRFDYFKPE